MDQIEHAREAARQVLSRLRCPRDMPSSAILNHILKKEGIQFDLWHIPNRHFAGILWYNLDHYVIMCTSRAPLARRLFTIAHELGHYYLHRQGSKNFFCANFYVNTLRERQANTFAAELLMPTDKIVLLLHKGYSVPRIAQYLQVSEEAVSYRVKAL